MTSDYAEFPIGLFIIYKQQMSWFLFGYNAISVLRLLKGDIRI